MRGRYVILYRKPGVRHYYDMVLCEVDVYSCPVFHWGEADCSKLCSTSCGGGGQCHMTSGECRHGCNIGFWGGDCSKRCRNCRFEMCNEINGACHHGCRNGIWGDPCSQACHCKDGAACLRNGGYCRGGCEPGYGGETENLCDTVLPVLRASNIDVTSVSHESAIITIKSPTDGATISGYQVQLRTADGQLLGTQNVQQLDGVATYHLRKLNSSATYSVTVTPMTSSPRGREVKGQATPSVSFTTSAVSSSGGQSEVIVICVVVVILVFLIIAVLMVVLVRFPACRARVTSWARRTETSDVAMTTVTPENRLQRKRDVTPNPYAGNVNGNHYAVIDDVKPRPQANPNQDVPSDPAGPYEVIGSTNAGYQNIPEPQATSGDQNDTYLQPHVTSGAQNDAYLHPHVTSDAKDDVHPQADETSARLSNVYDDVALPP